MKLEISFFPDSLGLGLTSRSFPLSCQFAVSKAMEVQSSYLMDPSRTTSYCLKMSSAEPHERHLPSHGKGMLILLLRLGVLHFG